MAKGQAPSSNCVYLQGQIDEILSKLNSMSLSDIREGHLNVAPVVQAVLSLETLKKNLPDML